MNPRIALTLLLLTPFVFSDGKDAEKPAAERKPVAARRATIRSTLDAKGRFVPAESTELRLDLQVYRGELRLVDVLPHGSRVNAGDIVARLDPEAIDRQITAERMSLDRAEIALRHAEEGRRFQAEADAAALERANVAADRAAKKLRGYREYDKPFDEENKRIAAQSRAYRLDDQQDELTQLEKMYGEDELVDATEEIVLKRQRRDFARFKQSYDLTERRIRYQEEFYDSWREEDLEREARDAASNLEKVKRQQEMGREKAEAEFAQRRYDVEQQRARFADLQHDKEAFVVRAPHRGILLHAGAKELEAGAGISNRAVFGEITKGDGYDLETSIPEKDALKVATGAAAEASPTAAPDLALLGRLEVDYLPGKDGTFAATLHLEKSDVRLRPGLTAKITVILAEARNAVVVPVWAVVERDGESYVWCGATAAGPFEERKVRTGIRDGEDVVIKDGVAEGEFVAGPK